MWGGMVKVCGVVSQSPPFWNPDLGFLLVMVAFAALSVTPLSEPRSGIYHCYGGIPCFIRTPFLNPDLDVLLVMVAFPALSEPPL